MQIQNLIYILYQVTEVKAANGSFCKIIYLIQRLKKIAKSLLCGLREKVVLLLRPSNLIERVIV